MNSQNMFSEAILDPSFKMEGPHLVAASAGTGKTYNIQNIYVRLVAECGLRVSQIQVMTYTEAATKELRDRVRRVLSDFARYLANPCGMKPDEIERLERLRRCIGENVENPDVVRARVELALMEFDQAAISTIHGFCRRALSRFAFETDSSFQPELEDNKAADLAQRASDWWRTERNHMPDELRAMLSLSALNRCVQELSQKADWKIGDLDENDPDGYLLARAKEINDAYERDRAARETQTFDDLLRSLREALLNPDKGPTLAARLREEFKAVLVDEFQDTDPVQYDIFRLVFLDSSADPRPSLFFVGDPKQAIYSFRGGDIFTYKQAVEADDVKSSTYRLDRNFRSTPRLIDAVNMIFRDGIGSDGKSLRTFGDDTIDYSDDLRSSDKVAALTVDGRDDPKPFRFIWVEKATSDRDPAVVDSVLSVLEEQRENGLTPKDIAILVSSHGNARDLRNALRDRGVPVVLQKAGNVFADRVAAEFRIVLQSMAMMGGMGQIRAALATSFFSYALSEVLGESGDSTLADMVGKFGEWNRIWLTRGFNAAFSALESDPRCDLRRRFAAEHDGERKLADLLQIVELASAAVRELGPAPELLVNWITDRINNAQEDGSESDAEEYARQLESESDAVRILTKHCSKGLEFPVVIVPVSNGKNASAPYFFHDGTQLVVSVDPSCEEKARIERDAETTRLLYVAFTRASKRTIVIAAKALREGDSPLAKLVANAIANGADRVDSPIGMFEFAVSDETLAKRFVPPPRHPRQLCAAASVAVFSSMPTKGSYSSLAPTAHDDAVEGHDFDIQSGGAGSAEADGHPIFSIGGGARTGTCWHDILERIPFAASDNAINGAVERSMLIHGVANAATIDWKSKVAVTADMIRKTLDYGLLSPSGVPFCLRDVANESRLSEWEFDFSSRSAADTTVAISEILREEWGNDPSKARFLSATEKWSQDIPKGFLKGYVDLMFKHGDFYYIVDWKSNVLNRRVSDFDADGVVTEMAVAGYFFQYLLYSVVLHRYLRETLRERYSWSNNFGGVRYYFLRGIAAGGAAPVFADRPSERLLDRLSAALGLEDK